MILTVNTRHRGVKSLRRPYHAFTAVARREHTQIQGRERRSGVRSRDQGPDQVLIVHHSNYHS